MQATQAANRPLLLRSEGARKMLQAWFEPHRRATAAAARQTTRRQELDRGHIEWLQRPAGRRVTCESGALWLTFDGKPVDVVLGAGESLRCEFNRRLGIYALAPSRFVISAAG
jgi:hypothetical protein